MGEDRPCQEIVAVNFEGFQQTPLQALAAAALPDAFDRHRGAGLLP